MAKFRQKLMFSVFSRKKGADLIEKCLENLENQISKRKYKTNVAQRKKEKIALTQRKKSFKEIFLPFLKKNIFVGKGSSKLLAGTVPWPTEVG